MPIFNGSLNNTPLIPVDKCRLSQFINKSSSNYLLDFNIPDTKQGLISFDNCNKFGLESFDLKKRMKELDERYNSDKSENFMEIFDSLNLFSLKSHYEIIKTSYNEYYVPWLVFSFKKGYEFKLNVSLFNNKKLQKGLFKNLDSKFIKIESPNLIVKWINEEIVYSNKINYHEFYSGLKKRKLQLKITYQADTIVSDSISYISVKDDVGNLIGKICVKFHKIINLDLVCFDVNKIEGSNKYIFRHNRSIQNQYTKVQELFEQCGIKINYNNNLLYDSKEDLLEEFKLDVSEDRYKTKSIDDIFEEDIYNMIDHYKGGQSPSKNDKKKLIFCSNLPNALTDVNEANAVEYNTRVYNWDKEIYSYKTLAHEVSHALGNYHTFLEDKSKPEGLEAFNLNTIRMFNEITRLFYAYETKEYKCDKIKSFFNEKMRFGFAKAINLSNLNIEEIYLREYGSIFYNIKYKKYKTSYIMDYNLSINGSLVTNRYNFSIIHININRMRAELLNLL